MRKSNFGTIILAAIMACGVLSAIAQADTIGHWRF